MRVVVYGEGSRELGEIGPFRSPLPEEALGAAHVLVRRGLEETKGVPGGSVRFEGPLRIGPRRAKGSDLLRSTTLQKLLTWSPLECPDLAVAFIDEEGVAGRKRTLLKYISGLPTSPRRVIAVPVREFEAWLLSDWNCVQIVLGTSLRLPPTPERLKPGLAKRQFAELLARSSRTDEPEVRVEIATQCDFERVRKRSRSFGRFLADLA